MDSIIKNQEKQQKRILRILDRETHADLKLSLSEELGKRRSVGILLTSIEKVIQLCRSSNLQPHDSDSEV